MLQDELDCLINFGMPRNKPRQNKDLFEKQFGGLSYTVIAKGCYSFPSRHYLSLTYGERMKLVNEIHKREST